MTDPTPDAPLRAQMTRESERTRKALNQPGFSRGDYARLLEMAEQAEARLHQSGIELGGHHRLARHKQVLRDLLTLAEDPDADAMRPTDAEVYGTGLEVGQLAHVIGVLAQPRGRWNDRLADLLDADKHDPQALRDRRFRMQLIAMCRQAGLKTERHEGELEAVLDMGRWRIGLAARMVEAPNLVEAAIASTSRRLVESRLPGLIALEVTSVVWPERTILSVSSDSVAVSELHRRADGFLVSNHDQIASIVDPSFAFGVLAVATIPTYNASSRHVAFSTSFRIGRLCEESDPRHERLVAFARRFGSVSG